MTSPRPKRISSFGKSRLFPPKDFFDSIGQKLPSGERPLLRKTDIRRSGEGRKAPLGDLSFVASRSGFAMSLRRQRFCEFCCVGWRRIERNR
jgi:hypothetical protein